MPKPDTWTGSDLTTRTEVVQYLKRHGGVVRDEKGLAVAKMRDDLGKNRAFSQLIIDMEHDGMVKREVRGRRTFSVELLDDWDLADGEKPALRAVSEPVPIREPEATIDLSGVDYGRLADELFTLALRKATAPSESRKEIAELRERQRAYDELRAELTKLRRTNGDLISEVQDLRKEKQALERNIETLRTQLDKPRRGGVPIRERLSTEENRMLERLMKSTPTRSGS